MTDDEVTDDDLELVARHGSGKFIRAVAVTKLAKRQGRLEELREKADDIGGSA